MAEDPLHWTAMKYLILITLYLTEAVTDEINWLFASGIKRNIWI